MRCLKGEDKECETCKDKVFSFDEWYCIGIRKPRQIIVRSKKKEEVDKPSQRKDPTQRRLKPHKGKCRFRCG